MSDIKVRVGQTNAVKVVSSVASEGGRAVVAENVIGGIASVSYLDVSGISTFNSDVYIRGNLGIGTLPSSTPTTNLIIGGNARVLGILTAKQLFSDVYGEFTGGSINARSIVGSALSVSGISTFSNGPVNIGGILKFDNNIRIGNLSTGQFLNPNPSNPDPDSGYNNILLGNYAGFTINSGYKNNIIGYYAGYNNTSGIENNLFGSFSGYNNQTGSFNIFLGSYSGISASTSNKIIIGRGYNYNYFFDSPSTIKNTQLAIGIRTDANPSKYWLVGNENFNVGIGTTNPSSKLTVGGDVNVSGILTATRIFSTVYGEFTGSVNANVITGTGLSISGVSTLSTVSVGNSFYYVPSYTNGVAYFNSSGLMVSTGSTNSNVEYTNYILTTDNSGIPIWSNVIDGGSY